MYNIRQNNKNLRFEENISLKYGKFWSKNDKFSKNSCDNIFLFINHFPSCQQNS